MVFNKKKTDFDVAIERTLREMKGYNPASEEYEKLLSQLERLHRVRELERKSQVSPDTLALIGANLIGIFMIITYERTNVITTKAMSFVIKPR